MMKKVVFLIFMVLGMLPAIAQKTILKGVIQGVEPQTKLLVTRMGEVKITDTLLLDAQGGFNIRQNIKKPVLYVLQLDMAHQPMVHVMMEPGDRVTLKGKLLKDYNFIQITESEGSENAEVYQLVNNALMQPNSGYVIEQSLREHPGCLMSAYLVTYFDRNFLKYVSLYELIRDSLIEKYPEDMYVKNLDQKIKSALLPGSEAPEIEMRDPQGNLRRLSDLRGKVVMIDFWASWCSPCRQENPNVVRLYHKYKDKGFDIFSVSMDNTRDAWLAAIAKDGLVWPNHVSDLKGWTSSGGAAYGIYSIPATVLIDREGKVIARNLRGKDLELKLKEIFE